MTPPAGPISPFVHCRAILSRLTPYIPALIILALCLPPLLAPSLRAFIPSSTPASHPSTINPLLYHFTHASILHLITNAAALLYFRPRWATAAVAYATASLAALCPITHLALPTCGLSGLISAAFARRYAAHRLPPWQFILPNLLFAFFPNFNYRIHILSFILAYIIWKIYYAKTTGPSTKSYKRTTDGETTSCSKASTS
jgi:hypothetical protein